MTENQIRNCHWFLQATISESKKEKKRTYEVSIVSGLWNAFQSTVFECVLLLLLLVFLSVFNSGIFLCPRLCPCMCVCVWQFASVNVCLISHCCYFELTNLYNWKNPDRTIVWHLKWNSLWHWVKITETNYKIHTIHTFCHNQWQTKNSSGKLGYFFNTFFCHALSLSLTPVLCVRVRRAKYVKNGNRNCIIHLDLLNIGIDTQTHTPNSFSFTRNRTNEMSMTAVRLLSMNM